MGDPAKLTAWERWELASFGEERREHPLKPAPAPAAETPAEKDGGEPVENVRLPTAEEIEQIHQQARDEGLRKGREEGYRAGFEAGRTQALEEARRLAAAADSLERYLGELDVQVADETLALAVELARQVIRQDIAARPETLLAVVREALAQLPHQHVAIYLHPEDASLLRSYLGDQLAHAGHRIHEDAKLARGDCVLEAGGSQVDATVAMRWQRVLASLGIESAWAESAVPPASTFRRGDVDEA